MELIKEIYEKGYHTSLNSEVRYKLRRAARGLVFREKKIAVLHATSLNIHKLPGGGIDKNESIKSGFVREVLEEAGCKISGIESLGLTIEYRDSIEMIQFSYVFICNAIEILTPDFTDKEKSEGFELVWLSVEEAVNVMKYNDKPSTYASTFIHQRDLAILEYYLRVNS